MFKKGSFEIGATIYPVAMKVLKESTLIIWSFSITDWVLDILLFVARIF